MSRFRRVTRFEGSETMERLSFGVLLISQLLATTAFMFVVPFMPLYVQQLGVEDPGDAAAWAGIINGASGALVLFGVAENGLQRDESEVTEREESTGSNRVPLPYRLLLPGLLVLFAVHAAITSAQVALPGFVHTLAGSASQVATRAGWIIGTRRVIVGALALAGLAWAPRFGSRKATWKAVIAHITR